MNIKQLGHDTMEEITIKSYDENVSCKLAWTI